MQIFIDRPQQLLKQVWKDKNVHIVEKQHVLGRDKFCLIDISLSAEGKDEDKMYVDEVFYRTNVRRGNTLVEIVDSKGKKKIMWGRKGTQKILDIKLEYIESVTRNLQLNKDEKKSYDAIFQNINRSLETGKRIELLKTEKANGQNAQVSYFYELDSWIICSKNVSMMASSLKDLDIYDGKRYTYAKAIAKQWFKEIEHLDKDKLKRLKKLLDGFTLVGQYCGNPEYQHLILYNEIRIIWFALIDNFTEELCIDPFQVRKDIEEFGLKFVRLKRMGSWNEKKKFYQQLEDLYLRIAQAGMQDQQYGMQGAIVYFVSPEFQNNKPHTKVLGAGKLKTLEYRFFRKIREKLSRFLNHTESKVQIIKKYEQQCEQLQKANYSPAPFPQFYYTQILQKGCELIRQTKISEEFFRSKFVSILKLLFYVIHRNISLKTFGKKLIKNQAFLDKVTKIPLSAFGTMGCSTKIVYVPIDLPHILDNQLSEQLSNHFSRLNLKFEIIESTQPTQDIQKVFTTINTSSTGAQTQPFLMHFYLHGDITLQSLQKLTQRLKYKGKKNVHHQFLLITDTITPQHQFTDQDNHEYPFRLQTIILSYWRAYKEVKNTPTIQEKIDVLKGVSGRLRERRDLLQNLEKFGAGRCGVRMSGETGVGESECEEWGRVVANVVAEKEEYQNYCRLILKLDKIDEAFFKLPNKEEFHQEVKSLIKSCFQIVPEIDFTEQ